VNISHHVESEQIQQPTDSDVAAEVISVCICTYQRAHVRATIESVAAQILPNSVRMEVIVVDNDSSPSAQNLVGECRKSTGLDLSYLHAPGRNISIARNAAMEAASTRWLAFIDDDELASPDWLAELCAARKEGVVVFGPSYAIYRDDMPAWMRRGDYHSNGILTQRGAIMTGYTSNVLFNLDFVRSHSLHFDVALGRSGGEDSIFFHAIYHLGGELKYAPNAIVYEKVAPSRAKFGWIVKRKFRTGQIYAIMFSKFDKKAYRRLMQLAPFKIIFCLTMSALMVWSFQRAMWWLMRGIYHSGALSIGFSANVYQEYAALA
jgi:succinoglycan biosynthesis protein ExoM